MSEGHPAFPRPRKSERHPIRWIVIGLIVAAILVAGWYWGLPALRYELDTVSTDDAFVRGPHHLRQPAGRGPRHRGDGRPGRPGRAGRTPGEARPRAVRGGRGAGRGLAGGGPGQRRSVAGAGPVRRSPGAGRLLPPQERPGDPAPPDRHRWTPRSPRSGPGSRADGWPKSTSGGSRTWCKRGSATQAELDQRNNTLKVAIEQEKEAWAAIQETRAAARPAARSQEPARHPQGAGEPAVDRPVGGQRHRLEPGARSASRSTPRTQSQARAFERFPPPRAGTNRPARAWRRSSSGPGRQGGARRRRPAPRSSSTTPGCDSDWTEIRSEIAGYVQDRQTNPGNRVEPGQTLALDPARLMSGLPPITRRRRSTISGSACPSTSMSMPIPHRVFHGRVAGFSPGTGLSRVAPAAGERHGQLREGDPAPAGPDRADRAEPGRHAAVRRPVGRPARPDQGTADRARCRPAAAYLRTTEASRRRAAARPASQPRNRELEARSPPGHEHGDRGDGPRRRGPPRVRRPVNHWIVALTVTLATFMEVLDTSIANVALPYIAGGLSVGRSQATWVLTSYLVANAIVLPLSGWLMGLFGRKRFYMTCVLLFTISSALCGAAPNIELLDPLPGAPGARRRRAPAVRAGHPGRHLPAAANWAWRWPCTAWPSSSRRSSGPCWADTSATTTPGAGSSTSTSRSASSR